MTSTALEPRRPVEIEDADKTAKAISRALRQAARQARAPASVVSGGAGFRARKGERAFRLALAVSFALMVALPTLAASFYWGLWAAPQYATEMKFAVRTGESAPLGNLGSLLGASPQQAQDTQIVANYILGRSAVQKLDEEGRLRRAYTSPAADYLSRLADDAPIEDVEKYWRKRVDVNTDAASGIVSVDVRAFTPEESLAIARRVLQMAEDLVNDLSSRSRRDALAQAQTELKRAETRLQDATQTMRDARNAEGVLDAASAAAALGKVVTALRLQLTRAQQERAALLGQAPGSPAMRVVDSRIASLNSQIDDYSRQIAGAAAGGEGSMATRLATQSRLQVEIDLARQQYANAAAVYENARVEYDTRPAYFAVFLPPSAAQKSTYPRRWWEWFLIVSPALAAWGLLISLAILARDNMAK